MSKVRVGVRVRPLTTKEHGQGDKSVVQTQPPAVVGIGTRSFTYDLVFDERVSQSTLYHQVSPSLLEGFLEGYNATIMAYGQTGSGKTFTMGSSSNCEAHCTQVDGHGDDNEGLITRFIKDIFDRLDAVTAQSTSSNPPATGSTMESYSVQASFLEVYGEDVHDLFDPDRKPLPLRDDANGGVVVQGLTYRPIRSAQDSLDLLHTGTLNRTTAATLMNLTSSRSHAVFTILLTQTNQLQVTTTSKFTFVDLAGSERMKKTGAQGERAREGIKINEGLLALGNVINALADDTRTISKKNTAPTHVPYRQAKLTRLLQDALGGNSQTLFLACVSPADTNSSETLSTLHYANRARNIKNAPTKNVLESGNAEAVELARINTILQAELVRVKFGTTSDNEEEVQQYLEHLIGHEALLSITSNALPLPMLSSSSSITPSKMMITRTPPPLSTFKDHENSILDETILEDVNPEEELAILDQLLELQSQDQLYSKQHKEGQEELKLVQGELDEQEALLLQLRESLKVYHSMKEKYQMLMAEVGQLEMEKASLADQLEKAVVDPTKGCSLAIKKKLERVEGSLLRARSETRKHQQRYREAEQQAQKCKALERKIDQLKHNKIAMIRKQKEASARHKEFTEAKTKEVLALKKKARNDGKKVTKLQTELQMHKMNLAKRKTYADKLASKLKETENHLMKLLTMRQRELNSRTVSPQRRQSIRVPSKDAGFGNVTDGMSFLLHRMVADRVDAEQTRQLYENRVGEYSEVMRQIVEQVRILDRGDGADEHEEAIEDLELKLEIISGELDNLKTVPNGNSGEHQISVMEQKAKDTVANLNAPAARALLWEFVDNYAESELERQRQAHALSKKDSIIESFEAEVRSLNERVAILSKDLEERRQLVNGNDPMNTIRQLTSELSQITAKYDDSQRDATEKVTLVAEMKKKMTFLSLDLQEYKEKLAVMETLVRQRDDVNTSERTLQVLQTLWRRIGVPEDERETARRSILTCLEDTCQRQVYDAREYKKTTQENIRNTRTALLRMSEALGTVVDTNTDSATTLLEELDSLQTKLDMLQPQYDEAQERKNKIFKSVSVMMRMMDMKEAEVSTDLQQLISLSRGKRAAMMKNVAGMLQALEEGTPEEESRDMEDNDHNSDDGLVPNSLESSYLDRCEKALTELRMKKSRKAVANADRQKEAYGLAKDMHLSAEDVKHLATMQQVPSWWDDNKAIQVAQVVVEEDGLVEVSNQFTQHLQHTVDVLARVAHQRRELSSTLKSAIDRAQRSLLSTVGEEVDASEAYASFHEALFNLPPLSKEHIHTCIEEISALTAGVEAMTQSEIEALTVVWEALHIGTTDRSNFWGAIDNAVDGINGTDLAMFESGQNGAEEWVTTAFQEASKANRLLSLRLHKLEHVHGEVERLRSRQDAKSRIISLDSEIRILSATLAEFEEQKCNKQRLLTKKASGGSSLLREERFRKQMQGKFVSKLDQLTKAVKSWKDSDGNDFDEDVLSEEVRVLLKNPNKMNTLVEKRTAFMHLRTVQSNPNSTKSALKSVSKRRTASSIAQESPLKRQRQTVTRKLSGDSAGSGDTISSVAPQGPGQRLERSYDNIPVMPKSVKKRKQEASPMRLTRRGRNDDASPVNTKISRTSLALPKKKRESSMMPFGNVLGEEEGRLNEKENQKL